MSFSELGVSTPKLRVRIPDLRVSIPEVTSKLDFNPTNTNTRSHRSQGKVQFALPINCNVEDREPTGTPTPIAPVNPTDSVNKSERICIRPDGFSIEYEYAEKAIPVPMQTPVVEAEKPREYNCYTPV